MKKKVISAITAASLAFSVFMQPVFVKAEENVSLNEANTAVVEESISTIIEETEELEETNTTSIAIEEDLVTRIAAQKEDGVNDHIGDDNVAISFDEYLKMKESGKIVVPYAVERQTTTVVSDKVSIVETDFKWNEELELTNQPNKLILHHIEASRPGQTIPVTDVHQWHLSNGWAGIGYHFYITKDGTIFRGRPENAIGAHASKNNVNTLGIAVEGTYMTEQMPEAQKKAVIELGKYLRQKYKIETVVGHRDVNATNCPGTNYPFNEIKNGILSASIDNKIEYRTHVQDLGWQGWTADGLMSGTSGQAKRLEGIEIKLANLPAGMKVKYRTHVENDGWQQWVYDGAMSGTDGQSKRLEGIEIQLEGAPANYHVEYRVHVENDGWQSWRRDGEMAGTSGEAKRLEGIEIRIVEDKVPDVSYQTHIQEIGWQGWKTNGVLSGTTGEAKRLEGINIKLENANGMNVVYRTHVENEGWQQWKRNGETSGSIGKAQRLEAIEIKLEGAPAGYHVEYRVHVKDEGWQDWKRDGELAGTEGKAKRLEAIEIRVVAN